ncbi:MAG: glycine--tRNA ligase subunit beta [Gammaproteobacteria bacterium]|nr:glycine--tRNA ligase subunit beta [Gammaproteobacteria bacterium]
MSTSDLLIEIGTEELPPKALLSLSSSFKQEIESRLTKAKLNFTTIEPFATPRRLALKVISLDAKQPDMRLDRFGPAIKAAFDNEGNPSKAAEGFARSCGVEVNQLDKKSDGKVDKLFFSSNNPGEFTSSLLPEMINLSLAALPIPKRMRWGSSREEFVRPAHWIVLLFGTELISADILGLPTTTSTFGHRFLHPESIKLNSADEYPEKLRKEGVVEPSFQQRKELIREQVLHEAKVKKATAIINENLLDEVTGLVEWPVALTGNFDPAFLEVPKEALISSLEKHQKYFYLLDKNKNLLPHFITISNLISADPEQVIKGNEKVIGPRLADAAFFYDKDKSRKLDSHIDTLKRVVFQKELGSLFDKSQRVKKLSVFIAKNLSLNSTSVARAAELSKCDLLSNMVGEFADLQGIMGHYYAINDGEEESVALAIEEQYLPRFAGDILPSGENGIVLALAERLDTITGLFGIGQPPSGSKDPFALRRAALGMLRIIIEKELSLDIYSCINQSISAFDSFQKQENLAQEILDFIFDRLRAHYADLDINTSIFQAVDAVRPNSPLTFNQRLNAVNHFSKLPEAEALAAANKRVANILSKLKIKPVTSINSSLLCEPAEINLHEKLQQVVKQTAPLIKNDKYQEALSQMALLQTPLDQFFDKVMVNADDVKLKENRQALLYQIRQLFLQVADISFLQSA